MDTAIVSASSTSGAHSIAATVLAYHAIGNCARSEDPSNLWVPTSAFERQMTWLAQHRRVVPLEDIVEGRPAGRPPAVALTFDDGYSTVLREAVPILERHGFPATMFVPTAHLGGENRWDPPQDCDLSIVGPDGLREFEARGVQVESHGHHHIDMSTSPLQDTREDLEDSWGVLREVLGRPPRYLAYPFRDGTDDVREVARTLGFRAAFSIDLPDAGRFGMGRVQVTPLDSDRIFALKTSGWWLRARYHPVLARAYALLKGALPERRPAD